MNFYDKLYRYITGKITYYLIWLRLGKKPRTGFWGGIARWLNLPYGWVAEGLDETEVNALLDLAKNWGLAEGDA